ncbi:MAG: hypothetical protein K2H56_02965 [Malacoplasma sp.]|nr:hypothetical protein [Malacoplasma sp.]
MKLKIEIFKNINNYSKLKTASINNSVLLLESENQWKEFFSQNIERKNNKNPNQNFINKRILKNIKGFELIIEKINFNKNINKGYFLDYSSFVGIFLYFESENDILNYVIDTCEARGDKKVNNFNEAINYLANENVTIASVIDLEIEEIKWKKFKAEFENLNKKIKN